MIGLTIAGFDPSGGAGILEDVKTMASFGLHPCAVVTSLTAQNPKKVFSVEPVRAEYISYKIRKDRLVILKGNHTTYK